MKLPKNISFAELYLDRSLFADEANKTIGDALIGQNADVLVNNRRKVTNRLTDKGQKALNNILDTIQTATGKEIIAKWDIHCGCAMCPCSPGFRLMTNLEVWSRLRDENRFNIWTDENGSIRNLRKPEYNRIQESEFYEAIAMLEYYSTLNAISA